MNDQPIPILAYAFIGITTLVLAYATFLDTGDTKNTPGQNGASATSLLPSSVQSLNPFANQPQANVSNTSNSPIGSLPIASVSNALTATNPVVLNNKPAVGGRTKRHKKRHSTTKRHRK